MGYNTHSSWSCSLPKAGRCLVSERYFKRVQLLLNIVFMLYIPQILWIFSDIVLMYWRLTVADFLLLFLNLLPLLIEVVAWRVFIMLIIFCWHILGLPPLSLVDHVWGEKGGNQSLWNGDNRQHYRMTKRIRIHVKLWQPPH